MADIQLPDDLEASEVQDEEVLARNINFAFFADEAKLISSKDSRLLSEYSESDREGQEDLLGERGPECVSVFVRALNSINAKEARQKLLALLDELLSAEPSRAAYFHAIAAQPTTNPYVPLLRILTTGTELSLSGVTDPDMYSLGKAARILSTLLTADRPEFADFCNWLITRIRNPQDRMVMLAMAALKDLLKNTESHERFARDGGFRSLMVLLKETQNTQLLYLAVFCLWLLSFNEAMLEQFAHHQAVDAVVKVIKVVTREKVIRLAFAVLKNLLDKKGFNEELIANGLVKVLDTISGRKWKDEDLVGDIEVVSARLEESVAAMSSFEVYEVEVRTGKMSWTPVHTSTFWRDNISKFERDNFALIYKLVELLDTDDGTVLEVVCFDLGEFARHHPDGRLVLQRVGGKSKLMKVLANAGEFSPAVGKQALLAVQKIMVQNWESLQSQGGVASLMNKK